MPLRIITRDRLREELGRSPTKHELRTALASANLGGRKVTRKQVNDALSRGDEACLLITMVADTEYL